jgi:hypothetical protein
MNSYKQKLNRKSIGILTELLKSLVNPDQAEGIDRATVMSQLGKRTYFKDQITGAVKLGLCFRQVRKEVKRNPNVTVEDIKRKHKLG